MKGLNYMCMYVSAVKKVYTSRLAFCLLFELLILIQYIPILFIIMLWL